MNIFKNKYRIQLHSDAEGFPNCWYIQKKSWWQKYYKFMVGYFPTHEEANIYMKSCLKEELNNL
jgi:hypothetical protein